MKTPGRKTDITTQSAEWISILDEEPTWYHNLEIRTPAGEILRGWARVSDGDHDYYISVDPNINDIIPTISHWRYINQHNRC